MSTITEKQVIDFLMKVASDSDLSSRTNPIDKYDSNLCLYYDGAGSSCIVGRWLHDEIGIDYDSMEVIEGKSAENAIDELICLGWIDDISHDAIKTLNDVQHLTDIPQVDDDGNYYRRTWGQAVDIFLNG